MNIEIKPRKGLTRWGVQWRVEPDSFEHGDEIRAYIIMWPNTDREWVQLMAVTAAPVGGVMCATTGCDWERPSECIERFLVEVRLVDSDGDMVNSVRSEEFEIGPSWWQRIVNSIQALRRVIV